MRSNSKFSIVGGAYREICLQPEWNNVFGSGTRAAAAVSGIASDESVDVEFITWSDSETLAVLEVICGGFGIALNALSRESRIEFQYDYPMGVPRTYPPIDQVVKSGPELIEGDCCLVFGMVESEPAIQCSTLIYDPQSGKRSVPPSKRSFQASRSAIVANLGEVLTMVGQLAGHPSSADPLVLGEYLRQAEGVDVVIVKNGCEGAAVISAEGSHWVPCYRTKSVFSIGSGDVFSAAFAWYWGYKRMKPTDAADLASAATSIYCENRVLPIPSDLEARVPHLTPLRWKQQVKLPSVYLAGPLFTLSQLWLLSECKRCLEDLGVAVFSPKDDVGYLGNAGDSAVIAQEDIAGLVASQLVFALIDGLDAGTIFEIGYARAKAIPVILIGERVPESELTMLMGTGCELFRDLTSAIYHAVWMLRSE